MVVKSPVVPGAEVTGRPQTPDRSFDAFVPRGVLHHLSMRPFSPVRTVHGTMLFADLSGFTRLSERLHRHGAEGAELLVWTINTCFDPLLRVAYGNGGSLVKFGGDALLLFFDGPRHAERACRSAVRMREALYRSALESARAIGLTGRQLTDLWDALGGALRRGRGHRR